MPQEVSQTKHLKLESYFDIQDGGGGHLGFWKIAITWKNVDSFQWNLKHRVIGSQWTRSN
jgi:hypothetical protein